MKVLCKKEAKKGLWLQERAVPEINEDEVLIKVKHASLCGTDLHIYKWDQWAQQTLKPPVVIGHEFMGHIEQLGSRVKGFEVGDRVSGEGHITCGHCRNCRAGQRHLCRNTTVIGIHRDGAFAEYVKIPASNAFKVPKSVPDEVASVFDPFGNAVHTALSFDLVGEDVIVLGAGPIGIMSCAIAKHVGARYIVAADINDMRLSLAKKMGATRTVNLQTQNLKDTMNELGMQEGFDVCFEMSGHPDSFSHVLSTMNHGGRVALLGIMPDKVELDWSDIIFKGLSLKGIYGREMFETWYKMSSMLQSGLQIDKIVSHRVAFENFEQAFDLVENGEAIKVVMHWEH